MFTALHRHSLVYLREAALGDFHITIKRNADTLWLHGGIIMFITQFPQGPSEEVNHQGPEEPVGGEAACIFFSSDSTHHFIAKKSIISATSWEQK